MLRWLTKTMTRQIVNGKRVLPGQPQRLRSGYRVILGDFYIFRFNDPEAARKQRDLVLTSMPQSASASVLASTAARPDSPMGPDDILVDWSYARRELALARLNGQDPALDHLRDEDLDKLFDDVSDNRPLLIASCYLISRPFRLLCAAPKGADTTQAAREPT